MESLIWESNPIGYKTYKIYIGIFNIIWYFKVQLIVTKIAKNKVPKNHLTYFVPLCNSTWALYFFYMCIGCVFHCVILTSDMLLLSVLNNSTVHLDDSVSIFHNFIIIDLYHINENINEKLIHLQLSRKELLGFKSFLMDCT